MISVRDAVDAALRYVKDLYGPAVKDTLLEEVEATDDKRYWLVTVGFNVRETEPATPLQQVMAEARGVPVRESKRLTRKYKTIRIDAQSGAVESMKVKEL
jgi:hypothetical protein